MWVRFCPVPKTQSTLFVAGSYRPITLAPSAVNQVSPATKAGREVHSTGRGRWAGAAFEDEVNNRERVIASAAVIGDVGGLAVGRGDHFVRIFEDWNSRDDFQRERDRQWRASGHA